MNKAHCCADVESHAYNAPNADGFRTFLMSGPQNRFSHLGYSLPGRQLSDASGGTISIRFCPWCGCNLKEYYQSEQSDSPSSTRE
jgi:hypothetical protein